MSFRTALIDRIVYSLRIDHSSDDPAPAIRAALRGDGGHQVSVIDHSYSGQRWIVIGAFSLGPGWTAIPRIVDTHLGHIHRTAQSTDWEAGLSDPDATPQGQLGWRAACTYCQENVVPRLRDAGWLGRHDQLTSEDVARWFAGRAVGADHDPEFPTWAPAAVDSFARVTMGGDLGGVVDDTDDPEWVGNRYEWYDLAEVPIGGSVYRLSSRSQGAAGTLWVFTRRDQDRWEVTIAPDVRWATTRSGHPLDAVVDGAVMAIAALAHEDDEDDPLDVTVVTA